jgi:hypothetical protein
LALAQQPAGGPEPAARREWKIIPLKNASAVDVATVLNNVFGGGGGRAAPVRDVKITVDTRTNSILFLGAMTELDSITKLIQALDTDQPAAEAGPKQQVFIYRLRHVAPDENLERLLNVSVQGQTANFAVDRQRKLIVLTGDRQLQSTVEALLQAIDTPDKPGGAELRVRLVWLVSGNPVEGAKPPADLADVLAELAKLGVDKVWLAAQVIVNASPNYRFQLDGTAKLDAPCHLTVSGELSDAMPHPTLDVDILATKPTPPNPNVPGGRASTTQLCKLRTSITTPLGQSVVLGVTPTDGSTSVFVVQVLKR